MPEILTESFCERCGTRYTFESATPRGPRLKGLKVMSRGLKNFVLSDDTSMDEAMAAARNETDREQTAQQLDAFHKTFNFCMSCRQYTCGNCWNEADGKCLSCAPHMGHEVLPAPFGTVGAGGAVTLTGAEAIGLNDRNGNGAEAAATAEPMAWPEAERMAWPEAERMAWPSSDLTPDDPADQGPRDFQEAIDAAARLEAVAGPAVAEPADEGASPARAEVAAEIAPEVDAEPDQVEPVAAAEELAPPVAAEEVVRPKPVEAGQPPVVPPPAGEEVDDRAAAAAADTTNLLRRFRPGENIDDEIAAYEREQRAVAGAAIAAAAETAAAEADAAEAAARAAAEMAAAEERAFAQVAEAEARAAADAAARANAEAEARAAAQAEAEASVAEAQARAIAEEQARLAAEEAARQTSAAEPEPEVEPTGPEPRDDLVYQPTWQIVAPEPPSADQAPLPQQPPVPGGPSAADPIAASAEPQWPSRPEWPRPPSAEGLPFLGRPAAASGGIEALWAESAREVASADPAAGARVAGGVSPCVSCGLSLSANARFCRRCGTRQG
jgi:hypothetical protein